MAFSESRRAFFAPALGEGFHSSLSRRLITVPQGTLPPRRRLRPRERKATAAARPSSPSRPPGCSTRGVAGGAGFATRYKSRKLFLCHCAGGKGPEYVTSGAAVRRECLRRRQLAFIGPPAPVLFHKLAEIGRAHV